MNYKEFVMGFELSFYSRACGNRQCLIAIYTNMIITSLYIESIFY